MMRSLRALALGVALLGAVAPVRAQVYGVCTTATPCRLWYGTASTNANGQWSATIPAGVFSSAPSVHATPISADNTAPNGAYASVVAPTASGGTYTVSGLVLLPAAIQALGGLPAKAAGQGITVMIQAVGY